MYNRRSQISKGKLVVLAAAILCAVVYVLTGGSATVVNTAPFELDKRIVLDAGHGGIDGGATGAHGELEKEINLNIVLQLKSFLEMQGFEVVTTREEDISIHDEKFEKISEQKISDIKNRLKIMEENKDGITISIHQNKFTQEKYNGAQVFYGSKNPLSKQLAQVMQDSFVKNWLRPAPCQFNLTYNRNHQYIPDFVVETENVIYLVEVKGEDKMKDADVLAKKKRGIQYCRTATMWGKANGYKEWQYLFYVDVMYDDYFRYRQSIDAVRPLTKELKILGEYQGK